MTTALRLHRQQCRNRSARSVYSVHSAWQVRRGFAATAGSSALRWRFPALWQLPLALLRSSTSLVLASNASVTSRNLLIGTRMQKYTAAAIIRKFNIAPSTAPNETVALLNVIASRPSIFGLPKIMAMNGLITLLTIELTTVVTAPPMTTPTAMSIMLPRAMNFLNPSIMMILPLCEIVRCCCGRTLSHAFRISIL